MVSQHTHTNHDLPFTLLNRVAIAADWSDNGARLLSLGGGEGGGGVMINREPKNKLKH